MHKLINVFLWTLMGAVLASADCGVNKWQYWATCAIVFAMCINMALM